MGKRPLFYGWWIVAVSHLCYLLAYGIGLFAFSVFLKPLTKEFGWSRAATAGGITMYHLPMFFLGAPLGVWTNRYGPRAVMVCGAALMGLSLLLLSRMSSLWELYLLRTVMGAGLMAATLIPIQTTLSHWFIRRRGTALGLAIPGIYIGGLLISPLAERLIASLGWRSAVAWLGALLLAVLLPLVALVMRGRPADMGLLPDGEEPFLPEKRKDRLPRPSSSSTVPWTLAGVLRTWSFWALFIAYFLFNGAAVGLLLHLAAYTTDQGFPPETGALAVGLTAGVGALGGVAFGLGADRLRVRNLLVLSLMLQALAAALLVRGSSLTHIYLGALLFGLATGGADELFALLTGEFFGSEAFGKIYGFLFLSPALAGTLGPIVAGLAFDATGSYMRFLIGITLTFALGAALAASARAPAAKEALAAT